MEKGGVEGLYGGFVATTSAGLGIAFLPAFIGDLDVNLERLFVVPLVEDDHLWLLIHADLRQTARVRAFVDFVTEAILEERSLYEGAPEQQ